MNRNEKRVLKAMREGYLIKKAKNGNFWLVKKVDENKFHYLSGVSLNTVCWLANHCHIQYIMRPYTFYYELYVGQSGL